jgi:ubiquitin carboxyl-terminal hydrolase 4/11/15
LSNSSNISIYDCLSTFGQEETLAGNDKWYCSKCKEHVPALKKMEIYKTPEFLIVHFKRFSHQRNSMFGSRKLNMQIDFPIDELDLTSYLVENIQPNAEFDIPNQEKQSTRRFIYDLYAVSNHYGSLNGGHYTAFCQNPIAKKWFEFDDSNVEKIKGSPSEV